MRRPVHSTRATEITAHRAV